MKFFTPEWYNDTIASDMHSQLRKTQSAAEFSEKFYEKLRKTEKKIFVKYSKRVARLTRQKFDLAEAERQFDSNYEDNLAFVKANLPAEILEKVKDIRVLALGSVDYDVATEIERFCGRLQRKCRAAATAYDESLEKTADIVGWETIHSLDLLAGCNVTSISEVGNKTIIIVSAQEGDASYKVELENASVVAQHESIIGSLISQHELTADGNTLSFGLLCLDDDSNAIILELESKRISITKR